MSLRDNLDRVNFTDPTKAEFRFVNREGNKGYKLFKWTSISTTVSVGLFFSVTEAGVCRLGYGWTGWGM